MMRRFFRDERMFSRRDEFTMAAALFFIAAHRRLPAAPLFTQYTFSSICCLGVCHARTMFERAVVLRRHIRQPDRLLPP